jgi:hypothetical protein
VYGKFLKLLGFESKTPRDLWLFSLHSSEITEKNNKTMEKQRNHGKKQESHGKIMRESNPPNAEEHPFLSVNPLTSVNQRKICPPRKTCLPSTNFVLAAFLFA